MVFLYDFDYEGQWREYVGRDDFFEVDAAGFSPYRHYLQSPEWKARRKKKLKKAGYRCEKCKKVHQKGVVLHVHHKTYKRVTREWMRDLQVLCERCHKKQHKGWE